MDRRQLLASMAIALVALSQRGFVDEVCTRCGRVNPEHGAGWRTVESSVVCPGCRTLPEQFVEAKAEERRLRAEIEELRRDG